MNRRLHTPVGFPKTLFASLRFTRIGLNRRWNGIEGLEPRLLFTHNFVVNNPGDAGAPLAALGIPSTNGSVAPNSPVTLRSALETANAVSDYTNIAFNLPTGTLIQPASPYPVMLSGVDIDGRNRNGGPGIVLNGRLAGTNRDGLYLAGSNNKVLGLCIQQFSACGIEFYGFNQGPNGNNNTVQACFIGTNLAGTAAMGNGRTGILIENSSNCHILNNVISGNGVDGIGIQQVNSSLKCSNNLIDGNFIGTNLAGTAAIPNRRNGIGLSSNCPANQIGLPGSGNLISGNGASGIVIGGGTLTDDPTSPGNVILSNRIGTNATATAAIPNGDNGILSASPHTVIGGAVTADRNIISGNGIGGALLNTHGIALTGQGSNIIEGNFIGTDGTSTRAIPNPGDGILINSPNNTIGGTKVGDANVISGNDRGIEVQGAGNNTIQGNFIGTDLSGSVAVGNRTVGIYLNDSPNNLIGGLPGLPNTSNPQTGNVISNSLGTPAITGAGILIQSNKNVVEGNFIGTDSSGTRRMGNEIGVVIQGSGNSIGGSSAGGTVGGNLISANTLFGIFITPIVSGSSADGNFIQGGNRIGTALNGTSALGNISAGIAINGSSHNTIGGTNAGQGNIIAFNGSPSVAAPGVSITVSGVSNLVDHNSIFSNTGAGILLTNGGNNSQAAPVVVNVGNTNNHPRVTGTLTSGKNQVYRLDFYSNTTATPQGRTWVGSTNVTTDGTGKASFQFVLNGVAFTQNITGTATDSKNNTSQFSAPPNAPPPLSIIRGEVYRDANKNKQLDVGELGLAGFTVFIDKNNNGKLDAGETSVVTGAGGTFEFDVPPGTYLINIVQRKGFTAIYPPGGTSYTITLGVSQLASGANFGFQ